MTLSGGEVSCPFNVAIAVNGGTATLSGGEVRSSALDLSVFGGMVTLSGGSWGTEGVTRSAGALRIAGCPLHLAADGTLTGPSAGITDALATFTYQKVRTVAGVAVNETDTATTASGGTQFRYDSSRGQYVYNWSTRGLQAGYVYELRADLGDGVMNRTVEIALK